MAHKKKDKKRKDSGNKSSKQKNSQQGMFHSGNSDNSGFQLLGMDAGDLGAALAGAMIGEITQVAMGKAARNAVDSDKLGRVRDAIRELISAVKGVLEDVEPVTKDAVGAAREAIHDPKASSAQVVDTIRDQTEATGHTAANVVGDTVNTVKDIIEERLEDVKSFPKRVADHQKN